MKGEKQKRKIPIKPFVFLVLIIICVIVANVPQVKDSLDLKLINEKLAQLQQAANRPMGPVAFILTTVGVILIQIPGLTMVVVGALLYEPGPAFAYSLIGATLGLTGTFLIARFFLKDYFLPKLKSGFLSPYMSLLESSGIMTAILLRLLFTMAPPLNWVLGATGMRIRDYMVGTLIGLCPMVALVVYATGRLKHVTSMKDLLQPDIMAMFAGFLVFVIVVFLLRRKFAKGSPESAQEKS